MSEETKVDPWAELMRQAKAKSKKEPAQPLEEWSRVIVSRALFGEGGSSSNWPWSIIAKGAAERQDALDVLGPEAEDLIDELEKATQEGEQAASKAGSLLLKAREALPSLWDILREGSRQ